MQQKKIIIFLIILFVSASAWLSYTSYKFVDPNVGKNWWVLNFTQPTGKDLDLTIENHSDQSSFHWEILKNNQKLQEGDATIEKGASQNVAPEGNFENGKFVVDVTTGSEKREIYKNL